jgi:hypothetical protein
VITQSGRGGGYVPRPLPHHRTGHLIALGSSSSNVACSNNTVIPPDGESGYPVFKRTMSTSVGPIAAKP